MQFIADNGYIRGNYIAVMKHLKSLGWNFETDDIIDVNHDNAKETPDFWNNDGYEPNVDKFEEIENNFG